MWSLLPGQRWQPVSSFVIPGINREIKRTWRAAQMGCFASATYLLPLFYPGMQLAAVQHACSKAGVTVDEMMMLGLGCFCWNNSPILYYIITEKWPLGQKKKKYGHTSDELSFECVFAYFNYSSRVFDILG